MNLRARAMPLFILSILTAPLLLRASSIEINGTCEVGSCTSAGLESSALSFGESTGPSNLTVSNFTVGSDPYTIDVTSYGASYLSGTYIYIDFSVTYTGSGPSSSADTLQVDELQDFFNDLPGTWDSPPNYTEHVPAIVGNGTTLTANLCYNGGESTQCVAQVGPVGSGTYDFNLSNSLIGLGGGDYLAADFDFILDFPAGTAPGTTIVLPSSVPEPSQTIPTAVLLFGMVCAIVVRGSKSLRSKES